MVYQALAVKEHCSLSYILRLSGDVVYGVTVLHCIYDEELLRGFSTLKGCKWNHSFISRFISGLLFTGYDKILYKIYNIVGSQCWG